MMRRTAPISSMAILALALSCGGGAATVEEIEPEIRTCLEKQLPGAIPPACLDAYLAAIRPDLEAVIEAYNAAGFDRDEVVVQLTQGYCSSFIAGVTEEVEHSSDSVDPKEPDRSFTEICLKVAAAHHPPAADSSNSPAFAPPLASVDEDFPCGTSGGRTVLCGSQSVFPPGEYVTAAIVTVGAIPLADAERLHQYGFVFDADGDASNNYQASSQFPNDFFDNTDRWYVASYSPADGWSLQVSDASGGSISSATSAARIIIEGQTMRLIVPATEFAISCPDYRMTAFTHTGDYGINPPHDWSADVEPAVALPLESTCVQFPALPPAP